MLVPHDITGWLAALASSLPIAGFLAGEAHAAKLFESPQRAAAAMLVQPEELQKELEQPRLRILDARGQSEYAKGHLPGAIRVDVKRWQQLGGREGGFHDAQAWGKEVGRLGIAADSQIVVYGSQLPTRAIIGAAKWA